MQICFVIFLGAGLGGVLRHFVNELSSQWTGINFPSGTLFVNILGSFIMGLAVSFFSLKGEVIPHLRLFLTTGMMGGFTTFSAYSLEVAMFYERGQNGLALTYALGSVILSVTALFLGLWSLKQLVG